MNILTNVAAELFESAGLEAQHPAHPCRMICREVQVRAAQDAEPIAAHTIWVTPDTLEVDCKDELDPQELVEVRLADGPEDLWCQAVVQHCVGTIIGYTIGLRME